MSDFSSTQERPFEGGSFADRFAEVVRRVGGVMRAAELCSVGRNAVYLWGRGTSRIPLDAAATLCRDAGVSVDWLISGGEGLPQPAANPSEIINKNTSQRIEKSNQSNSRHGGANIAGPVDDFDLFIDALKAALARTAGSKPGQIDPATEADVARIWEAFSQDVDPRGDFGSAVISEIDARASAGHGAWNERSVEVGRIAFPLAWLRRLAGDGVNPAKCDFLRVAGDSMTPTIADRALLLVDRNQTQPPASKRRKRKQDDDIFVFLWDGDLKVKRLARLPDLSLISLSDNAADYPPEVIDRHAPVAVLGRVVWWDNRL